jgi:hypothetical protein
MAPITISRREPRSNDVTIEIKHRFVVDMKSLKRSI